MFAIGTLLAAGGVLYAGAKVAPIVVSTVTPKISGQLKRPWRMFQRAKRPADHLRTLPPESPSIDKRPGRNLTLSGAALGMASIGALTSPVLLLASAPLSLYIFLPTFKNAWQTLRHEHRITTPVLDATRVALCLLMGYLFAAALNAWLQALSQRLLTQSEDEFNASLHTQFGTTDDTVWVFEQGAEIELPLKEVRPGHIIALTSGEMLATNGVILYGSAWIDERVVPNGATTVLKETGDHVFANTTITRGQIFVEVAGASDNTTIPELHATLHRAVERGTILQRIGETSGDRMAPLSLLAFLLTLPAWGGNRAAAFLTTSFGVQMRQLGPYLRRNFVDLAARQRLIVQDARALELANLVNTIIIDARTVADPATHEAVKEMVHKLRQRPWVTTKMVPHPFAVYLLAAEEGEEPKRLTAELGLDDYFVEPLLTGRTALLEQLQAGGRFICYVGNGIDDDYVMRKAFVSVSTGGAATLAKDSAQIVLLDPHPAQLEHLFDVAARYAATEGTSITWPFLLDLLDIGTTVFVHLGLVYSLFFNYSGFFFSALNGRAVRKRYLRAQEAEQEKAADAPADASALLTTLRI